MRVRVMQALIDRTAKGTGKQDEEVQAQLHAGSTHGRKNITL